MGVDPEMDNVIRLSLQADRLRSVLQESEEALVAAQRRHREAQRECTRVMQALDAAIKEKAAKDLERAKLDAFKIRYAAAPALVKAGMDVNVALPGGTATMGQPGQVVVQLGEPKVLSTATSNALEALNTLVSGKFADAAKESARPEGTIGLFDWRTTETPSPEKPDPSDISLPMRVRKLFARLGYGASLNATEVAEHLQLPPGREPAVRQALRRLYEEEFLMREERGYYGLNPNRHKGMK